MPLENVGDVEYQTDRDTGGREGSYVVVKVEKILIHREEIRRSHVASCWSEEAAQRIATALNEAEGL